MMLQKLSAFLVLIAAISAGPASARTPDEIRIAIKGKMSERHPDRLEEFWNSLGAEALPILKQMYGETQNGNERGWLLDGISHFDDPSIAKMLESEISKQDDDVLKRKQLSALIRSQGEGAYEFVEPYLRDQDPNIRKAVAQGLKQYGGNSGRVSKRLQEYLSSEKVAWVKDSVAKTQAAAKSPLGERNIYSEPTPAPPAPTPLPPKNWAGEWKGAWITPDKKSEAVVNLVRTNGTTEIQPQWRIELKLPKKTKMELKAADIEMSVFQSATAHWLEIRHKKLDAVFIAQRKAKE